MAYKIEDLERIAAGFNLHKVTADARLSTLIHNRRETNSIVVHDIAKEFELVGVLNALGENWQDGQVVSNVYPNYGSADVEGVFTLFSDQPWISSLDYRRDPRYLRLGFENVRTSLQVRVKSETGRLDDAKIAVLGTNLSPLPYYEASFVERIRRSGLIEGLPGTIWRPLRQKLFESSQVCAIDAYDPAARVRLIAELMGWQEKAVAKGRTPQEVRRFTDVLIDQFPPYFRNERFMSTFDLNSWERAIRQYGWKSEARDQLVA